MAISNFTGSAQLDAGIITELRGKFVETAYARAIMDDFCRTFGGHDFVSGSLTKTYDRLGKITAGNLTEGTDASATTLSDTEVSLTVSERGIGVLYGDQLDVGSAPGNRARVAGIMGKGYADWVEQKLLDLATSFTAQKGTSGATADEDLLLAAINAAEVAELDGPLFAVVFPTFIHNLRGVLGNSSTTNPVFMRADVLSRIGPAMTNSYVGTLFEVDMFKSTNCPLDTSAVDRVSVLLPMHAEQFPLRRLIGVPHEGPFAGTPWDGRVTFERDESGRLTEMWATGDWDVDAVALDWGVGMTSIK